MKKEIILLISTIFSVNVITAQDVESPVYGSDNSSNKLLSSTLVRKVGVEQ